MITSHLKSGISYITLEGTGAKGSVLIFLPGVGACKKNYIYHLESFRPYYSKIYSIDLPEQGSKGEWKIGTMVDNLAKFIRIIDSDSINKIDLAGHSGGALAILSFIFNYNSKVEMGLLKNLNNINNSDHGSLIKDLLYDSNFAKKTPESIKVDKLFLYAPPDNFNIVLPRKLAKALNNMKESHLALLLNTFINRPLLYMSYLKRSKYFKFKISDSKKPQFFCLIVQDHTSILDYIESALNLFEVIKIIKNDSRYRMDEILKGNNILIQYGSLDWILKPFFTRAKSLEETYKFSSDVKTVRHKNLGHFLNKKMGPDINLNAQMLTNKNVIYQSIEHLRQ